VRAEQGNARMVWVVRRLDDRCGTCTASSMADVEECDVHAQPVHRASRAAYLW
jgi:hypothetical protein